MDWAVSNRSNEDTAQPSTVSIVWLGCSSGQDDFWKFRLRKVFLVPRKLWILWMCGSSSHFYVWTYGSVSKPCSPGEHQNRWQMDVHPLINCIYRYWSIAIWKWSEDLKPPTGNKSARRGARALTIPGTEESLPPLHATRLYHATRLISRNKRQTMFRKSRHSPRCLDENPKFSYVA